MKYIIIGIVLAFIVLILLSYPFKIIVYNDSNYLHVNISNFIILRLNLLVLLDNVRKQDLKNQTKGAKVIKKLRFKSIDLQLKGLNFDYQLNGAYYGLLCAFGGFTKKVLESKNVDFNYDFQYLGDKSIEFQSVIRARAIALIGVINSI